MQPELLIITIIILYFISFLVFFCQTNWISQMRRFEKKKKKIQSSGAEINSPLCNMVNQFQPRQLPFPPKKKNLKNKKKNDFLA